VAAEHPALGWACLRAWDRGCHEAFPGLQGEGRGHALEG